MAGPLTAGTPTDRLVAEWWIRRPHVERRLSSGALIAKSAELRDVPLAIAVSSDEEPGSVDPDLTDRRVLIPVPTDFTTMQQREPDQAMRWRHAVREAFLAYLPRGYRAVDFSGAYLLAKPAGDDTK
jgi:predicted GNAT superfamily acetyltransferase